MVRKAAIILSALAGVAFLAQGIRADEDGMKLRFTVAPGADDRTYAISAKGRIADATTGAPIAGATVRAWVCVQKYSAQEAPEKCPQKEVMSGPDGSYEISLTSPLTTSGYGKGLDGFHMSVSAVGYGTRAYAVKWSLTAEKTSFPETNVALQPGRPLTGRVVGEDGNPLVGALVVLDDNLSGAWIPWGAWGRTYTGDDGKFELWIAKTMQEDMGDRAWLDITKMGYGGGFFWALPAKQDQDMGDLVVKRGGTIIGKVVDTDGKPIPNCQVRAYMGTEFFVGNAVTDADGKYELQGVFGDPTFFEFESRRRPNIGKEWQHAHVDVFARANPAARLQDSPSYTITPLEGKTLTAPDLVFSSKQSLSGKLVAAKTLLSPGGLMVRMDSDWDRMVQADGDGNFTFAYVPPGDHTLTAYLPNNLRGDRGIGRAKITMKPNKELEDVRIELDDLAEARLQIVDADGNPLQGITAGATWSKSGDGFWTEGTTSDADGMAMLYLYPDSIQYVRGFDMKGNALVTENFQEVKPQAGEVIDNIRIVIVAQAQIMGRLLDSQNQPFAEKFLQAELDYADGVQRKMPVRTDAAGGFKLEHLVPGVIRLKMSTQAIAQALDIATPFEIKPGEVKGLGDVAMQKVALYRVSGRLLPSKTFTNLEGFKIRLDLAAWEPLIPTDKEGRFVLPQVPAGQHRLIAYLPYNLRTDRGVGSVEIEVKGADLEGVELPLETLATVHVLIQDEKGNPLKGIAAAAWWTADHTGVFTEGTKSDVEGRATVYMYPGDPQYVGAHDWDGKYQLKNDHPLTPKVGEVVSDLRVTMTPAQ
jgi:protocatechuate 3,4-dioxygenase beta subunit